jgi:hypothetical protein
MFYNSINAQDFKYFNKCAISNSSNQSFSLIKSNNPIDDHSPYELDRNREILLLGSGGILGITGLALINNIQPLTLEEIYQLDPADVNKFDRHAIGPYRTYKAGDFLLYGSLLLPLTFLSNKEMKRDIKILGIIGLESGMDKKTSKEAKLSFYSGHTSTTAAMCFYTAKVFSDYLPDGPTKTLIWTGAIIYPALAGYLRVASANHFPTDVIVGYTVGALIGYYIPQLHKRDEEDGLSVFPSFKYNHLSLSAIYSFEFD